MKIKRIDLKEGPHFSCWSGIDPYYRFYYSSSLKGFFLNGREVKDEYFKKPELKKEFYQFKTKVERILNERNQNKM